MKIATAMMMTVMMIITLINITLEIKASCVSPDEVAKCEDSVAHHTRYNQPRLQQIDITAVGRGLHFIEDSD